MDKASDYGSEDSRFDGWLALQFFCISLTPLQTAEKIAFLPVFVVIVVPLFVCFFTDVL